jgi:predicted CoA-substrate-specific enzyme activase
MDDTPDTQTREDRSTGAALQRVERLRAGGADRELYLGIDIGSTSSDVVVLDADNKLVFTSYQRTLGKPLQTLHEQLRQLLNRIDAGRVSLAGLTGAAARSIARLLELPFINEVLAQAAAVCHLYPQLGEATVIEMGGQDSKLIFLYRENGQTKIRDFTLNTVCAAGTGSFLDQQAERLGINIEGQFGRLALASSAPPRIAGRCSVFAKTDMIHLQQQATPVADILAGLCQGLARNLKSNLGCGREFVKPVVFTGGVAANVGVVKALQEVLDLADGQLLVPAEHLFTGAIGAVLLTRSSPPAHQPDLLNICEVLDHHGCSLDKAPRLQPLAPPKPAAASDQQLSTIDYRLSTNSPIDAYLGLDVGSISTKVAVIDQHKRLLAKVYLMTAGRPLEAVRTCLAKVAPKLADKVTIRGAATTGSGRYLTGDFIGADIVINEITAQATGAAIVNPAVDTIFEIGGQDSKYISLADGVVVDFEMNHACAAGTGSFLEEQAQRLGISIQDQFAKLAFSSKAPIKLGERCTVFMESDLLTFLQQGARTEDLVAGLSYSVVTNYLNRVVGRRRVGQNICFQGGTAFNHAVWAAFEQVTGRPVMVPDHHEVTGAIGAAAIAAEYVRLHRPGAASSFRGFETLAQIEYTVQTFTCEKCPNNCEIKKVQLPQAEPLYYGSRCDRYNIKKKQRPSSRFAAFEYRRRKLFEYAGLDAESHEAPGGAITVGIPLALANWQLLPMFGQFFRRLGCRVVVSSDSNNTTIRRGVESVAAQTCFPVKVAYGHILELIDKGCDFIFLPSIVSMPVSYPQNSTNHLCPYLQTLPYQIKATFEDRLGRSRILSPVLHLDDGRRLLEKTFWAIGKQIGATHRAVRKAVRAASAAQQQFEKDLVAKGTEMLAQLAPAERLFVLVSRSYNGCDAGMNLQLPAKLHELGAEVIPMDMLPLAEAALTDPVLHRHTYWKYGQHILRAAEIIRRDDRLYGIYLSNFSCGPDSFLVSFFKDIMGSKPCLELELDEHSAGAGVITRLEAFLDSLKHYRPIAVTAKTAPPPVSIAQAHSLHTKRKLYIPWMGDASYSLAACFRGHGQPADVLPLADEITLLYGRQYTTGKECLPCTITAGDMVKIVKSRAFEPDRTAFFMPSGSGPCRFGMYYCLHQLILRQLGAEDVPIIAPNQDSDLYNEFRTKINFAGQRGFVRKAWLACVGADLLGKVIRLIRPYAVDRCCAQSAYQNALKMWNHAIEMRYDLTDLCRVMADIAEALAAVELDRMTRKPLIGIVGEIYVRSHDFANQFLIDRLERLGAACELAPFAEWIYYTNWTRWHKAWRKGELRTWLSNVLQDIYQHRTERLLAAPLERRFGPLAEQSVQHVLDLAQPYIDPSFEGEAVLSVGKTLEYHHRGFGGVVNTMPFTCMPSTIVSTQTPAISRTCGNMPILNLSFDGQTDPALETRLEAFVEHVRQRQHGGLAVTELIKTAG